MAVPTAAATTADAPSSSSSARSPRSAARGSRRATRETLVSMAAGSTPTSSSRGSSKSRPQRATCSSGSCATCCSPAPTPTCTRCAALRAPRLRRLPPDARAAITRRQLVGRALGAGLTVYGLQHAAGRVLEAAEAAPPSARRAGARHGVPARRLDLLVTIAPPRRRAGCRPARALALPDARRAARRVGLARAPLAGQRPGGGVAGLFARARSASCRASTTRTPTSRTSTRATSGRRADHRTGRAPAGSAAGSTATAPPTTRCRASRSTAACRRCCAPARAPVASVSAPDDAQLWMPARGARPPTRAWPPGTSSPTQPVGAQPGPAAAATAPPR